MPVTSSTPLESVWRWLQGELNQQPVPPLLLVIGLGGGGLLEVLDAKAPGTRVLALEPDPVEWQRTVAMAHVENWRRAGRLVYLSGPAYAGADEAWRVFPSTPDGHKVILDPRLSKGSATSLDAARVMKRIVFGVRANAQARKRFAPKYLTNVLQNLPAMTRGRDIRALTDRFKGIPAIVVAAGPSLDTAIDQIAEMPDRGVIIAADTALRPLLAAGIDPHFVVGVDPGQWNARHFHSLPDCSKTWLISESALDPSAVNVFGERTFWFRVGDHQPWPWLKTHGLDVGHVAVWGSVLTAAFQIATIAGCDPIVIVGADLAYTGRRPYCRGTTYEFDWAFMAAGGNDLASSWQAQVQRAKARTVPDLHGRETISTESMLSFRDWMVARAQRSGRRVINATGAGILFGEGVEQMSLSDALTQVFEIPDPDSVSRAASTVDLPALVTDARRVHELLSSGRHTESPVGEWAEFCDHGFEVTAAESALADAVRSIESNAPQRLANPRNAWSRPAVRATLSRLSEALTRFRAGLNDVALPDAVATHLDASQRPAILRDALKVLHDICASSSVEPDVTALGDPAAGRDNAVSLAYSWSQETRWAILAFEALLGRAWTSCVPLRSSPFDDRLYLSSSETSNWSAAPVAASGCSTLAQQWLRCVGGLEARDVLALRQEFVEANDGLRGANRTRLLTGAVRALFDGAGETRDESVQRGDYFASPQSTLQPGTAGVVIAYSTPEGVVCVAPHSQESVIICSDRSQRTQHAWPRPIITELAMGETGAVAWGNGLSDPERKGPGYVMYRRRAADEATIVDLPIRPSAGVWWRARLYWSCLPSGVGAWQGVASWAPGETVRFEVPGVVLYDMYPAGEELILEPRVLDSGESPVRELVKSGWRLRETGDLWSRPLGPYGASASRASCDGWTATAYPEADVITIASPDGVTSLLTCHYPFRVAWLGHSLLVSTADRDLLRFDQLIDPL